MVENELDPYEAFDHWLQANGYNDVSEACPEEVDLVRLHEAVDAYYLAGDDDEQR